MQRVEFLDRVLRHLMAGPSAPLPRLHGPAATDPFARALVSLTKSWHDDFRGGARAAAGALAAAADPDSRALARAAAGFATGMWLPAYTERSLRDPSTGADPILAALADDEPMTPFVRPAAQALLAEAALANARIDIAAQFLDRITDAPAASLGTPRPFLTFIHTQRARVAIYQGEVTQAARWAEAAVAQATDDVESLFAFACLSLTRGTADHRSDTAALIARVSGAPAPVDAFSRGCFVLAAYGARALGNDAQSARLTLLAGGDDDLSRLRIVDRAFGLEALVAAAIRLNDIDAAESWLARLQVLADHPIAAATVLRAQCRHSLAIGAVTEALAQADQAVAIARAERRAIEETEAEVLRARAHIAQRRTGAAARELARLVDTADARGHFAVRRTAARELRRVGRRLPPTAASGWGGLSAREREVALLIAQGKSNAAVADELFVSPHTVRRHVTRVLAAFAVATRAGVARTLAQADHASDQTMLAPALTARQSTVARMVAEGMGNRGIADSLGIGLTTVEKHVGAIKTRWQVASRAEIAALAGSLPSPV